MCKCTPSVRTPFCGYGSCVPSNQNVEQLVPWGKVTPIALSQQLLARFQQHQADGEECALLAVRAYKNEAGNWVYQGYNSAGSGEVLWMMCHMATEHIKKDL